MDETTLDPGPAEDPPEGFTLEGEESRETEAASSGITERADGFDASDDAPDDVDEGDGAADDDDEVDPEDAGGDQIGDDE